MILAASTISAISTDARGREVAVIAELIGVTGGLARDAAADDRVVIAWLLIKLAGELDSEIRLAVH